MPLCGPWIASPRLKAGIAMTVFAWRESNLRVTCTLRVEAYLSTTFVPQMYATITKPHRVGARRTAHAGKVGSGNPEKDGGRK